MDLRLTYEQLKPSLFKWAGKYQNNQFEFWELINAAWLGGRIQKIQNRRYISVAVRCAMVDYMRGVTKSQERKRRAKKGIFYPHEYNFTSVEIVSDGGHDKGLGKNIESSEDSYKKVDEEDYFNQLMKGFTRREKLIIRLRYKERFTLREIGKIVGVNESYISVVHTELMKRLWDKIRKHPKA